MARPFQGEHELLKVRGLSSGVLQQWQDGDPCPDLFLMHRCSKSETGR